MISWLIIGLLILGVVILIKFKEIRHRTSMFAIMILLLFLVITVSRVYANNKVDLNSLDGLLTVGRLYFSWLGNVLHNSFRATGYAFNLDWGFNLSSNVSQMIK